MTACVFCLANGQLAERQILVRGKHLYLCAPRGQLVEGCLIVAPYECVGCFAHASPEQREELVAFQALVQRFYAEAYGVELASFYEQGRAGGGAATDALGGFPHHAHLCCLPVEVDLHALLRDHAAVPVGGASEAAAASAGRPYAYVEAAGSRAVYVPSTERSYRSLERLRLKPRIAELLGLRGRGDWRSHPGDEELEHLIRRFRTSMNAMV